MTETKTVKRLWVVEELRGIKWTPLAYNYTTRHAAYYARASHTTWKGCRVVSYTRDEK